MRDAAKPLGAAAVGALTVGLLRATRYFDPAKTADLFGRLSRLIGSKLREDKIGRDNLKAAFPEKTPEEIEAILASVWDNLGRVGAEFAHLDRIWDYDRDHPEKLSNIDLTPRTIELFDGLRNDGKPALIFASHRSASSSRSGTRSWPFLQPCECMANFLSDLPAQTRLGNHPGAGVITAAINVAAAESVPGFAMTHRSGPMDRRPKHVGSAAKIAVLLLSGLFVAPRITRSMPFMGRLLEPLAHEPIGFLTESLLEKCYE